MSLSATIQRDNVDFEDVFQTDDVNFGIRMEFDKDGGGALVIGDLTGNPSELLFFSIPRTLDPTSTIDMELSFSDKLLYVKCDDSHQQFPVMRPIGARHLIIGQGFDDSRPFKGSIHIHRLQMTTLLLAPMRLRIILRSLMVVPLVLLHLYLALLFYRSVARHLQDADAAKPMAATAGPA